MNPWGILASACQLGLEGVIGKRRGSDYRSGRSNALTRPCCSTPSRFALGSLARGLRGTYPALWPHDPAIAIDTPEELVTTGQMDAIELHTWNSTQWRSSSLTG